MDTRPPSQSRRPVRGQQVQIDNTNYLKDFARLYTHFFLSFLLCFGCFCITASHLFSEATAELSENGGVGGNWQALKFWTAFTIMPFSESIGQSILPDPDTDLRDLICCIPLVCGYFTIGTVAVGYQSLMKRSRWATLAYGILALAMLPMKAEVISGLEAISESENLEQLRNMSATERLTSLEFGLLRTPYEVWSTAYDEEDCVASKPKASELPSIRCNSGSIGDIIERMVTNVCFNEDLMRAPDRKQRVKSCRAQGKEFGIFPPASSEPKISIFCNCRAATFDWIQAAWDLMVWSWCAELVAIFAVGYFAVEKNLDKMGPQVHREVVALAVAAVLLLVGRALVFNHYFIGLDDPVS